MFKMDNDLCDCGRLCGEHNWRYCLEAYDDQGCEPSIPDAPQDPEDHDYDEPVYGDTRSY